MIDELENAISDNFTFINSLHSHLQQYESIVEMNERNKFESMMEILLSISKEIEMTLNSEEFDSLTRLFPFDNDIIEMYFQQ